MALGLQFVRGIDWDITSRKKTPAAAAGVLVQKTEKVAASELCGKIPVDFEADANLDKCGGAPGHFRLLAWCAVNLAPFSFE